MIAFTPLTLISLAFIASSATATSPISNALLSLGKRQTGISPSDFPTACQSGCSSVLSTVTTCESADDMLSCTCTSANVAAVQSCVNCVVSNGASAAVLSAGEAVLQGQGVPSLTVPATSATGTAAASSSTSTTASGGSSSPFKNGAGANAAVGVAGLVGLAALGFVATVL
ncbi:hypothetical protein HWV62_12715 [Athelia sp. TMB]|nr:hypothetical protein HWV62_12715 [Athelia sp. TMB]